MAEETSSSSLHYKYIIGILIFVVIVLATIVTTPNEAAVSYIGFAATISSLLLAIVAIIYAFSSSSSLTRTTIKLSDQVAAIETASQDMIKVASEIPKHLGEIQTEVGKQSVFLNDRLSNLPDLSSTSKEIRPTQSASAVENKETIAKPAESELKGEKLAKDAREEIVNKIIGGRSSVNGLLCLYACTLSYKTRKSFTSKFINELQAQTSQYWLGFAVGLESCGLMTISISDDVWNVTSIPTINQKNLRKAIIDGAEGIDTKRKGEGKSDVTLVADRIGEATKKIDEFFLGKPEAV